MSDTITALSAKTRAGWRAKAEVLDASIRLNLTDPDPEHRLALSLV